MLAPRRGLMASTCAVALYRWRKRCRWQAAWRTVRGVHGAQVRADGRDHELLRRFHIQRLAVRNWYVPRQLGAGRGDGCDARARRVPGLRARLFSGRAADRNSVLALAVSGYVVQMAAVPLLALAGTWQFAALLIIAEGSARRPAPRARCDALARG